MCDFPVTYARMTYAPEMFAPETYAPALSGTPSNFLRPFGSKRPEVEREGELVTTVGVESAYVKVYVYVAPAAKSEPMVVINSSPKLGEVADRPEECVNQGKDANQERALE